jgi:hypothetical protein
MSSHEINSVERYNYWELMELEVTYSYDLLANYLPFFYLTRKQYDSIKDVKSKEKSVKRNP